MENEIKNAETLAEAADVKSAIILPCPFCGADEPTRETVRAYRKSDWRSTMHCASCGASSGWSDPMGHDDSEKAAVEIWNRRIDPAAQPKAAPPNRQPVHLASG